MASKPAFSRTGINSLKGLRVVSIAVLLLAAIARHSHLGGLSPVQFESDYLLRHRSV